MSGKITTSLLVFAILGLASLMSCSKNVTVIVPDNQEITKAVSFKSDLTPLFTKHCSISGCHNTGGLKPDLSATNAYNSLINGNYVDLDHPENSSVYLWLTGKKSIPMPVGAPNNPGNINQYVLAWIKQGAMNN